MATPVLAFAQLANECEPEGLAAKNAEKIGGELAKMFNVQPDEVAVLKVDKQSLMFAYPTKLGHVGSIPINASAAMPTVNSRGVPRASSCSAAPPPGGRKSRSPARMRCGG